MAESHSYSDYRRLSPDENERQGFSRKARQYVLKSIKRVTKHTPSITARAHETLRTRQVPGWRRPNKRPKRGGRAVYPIPVKTKRSGSQRPRIGGLERRRGKASANGFPTDIQKRERLGFISHTREWKPMNATASASCAANGSTMSNGLP